MKTTSTRPCPQSRGRARRRAVKASTARYCAVLCGSSLNLLSCDDQSPNNLSSDRSPETTNPPAQVLTTQERYALGETAATPHFTLKLSQLKPCSVEPHFSPPRGVRKLGLLLELSGSSSVEVPVNPFYALLHNSDGDRFEATLIGCTPQLRAGRLSKGQSASGWVTFDIPDDDASPLRFSYSPVMIGAGRQEVSFQLDVRHLASP